MLCGLHRRHRRRGSGSFSTGPAGDGPPTLLCTVTFPANTGFAWDFIERLYARMANKLLEEQGVRTIGNQIQMLGYLSGASGLLRAANVCVVPSVWEDAFPLSILEMMARGRALVATHVGGVPEMIEHGVSGVLVPGGNVTALAEALASVVSSPSLQQTLGNAARERASRLFTANEQIEQLLSTFDEAFVT